MLSRIFYLGISEWTSPFCRRELEGLSVTLLPIILFVLGVIILIWAMRMGNSSPKSSQETLTILQGLAGLKKEVNKLQRGIREVESQLGDHELRLIRNENVQADLRSEVNAQKISINQLPLAQPLFQPQPQALNAYNNPYIQSSGLGELYPKNERKSQEETPTQVLPEKYQWVLELYNQGWSVAEIAGHLSISRDAVNMVLRTAPIGKELEL